MNSILCIETATEVCSVAVVEESRIVSLVENHDGNMHASKLTSLIEEAVKKAGLVLNELSAIAVSMGPGSYTGLRVGVSTAKGLCYALEKPLIAVPTLQTLATMGLRQIETQITNKRMATLLVPMLDARRMEVYCAGYDAGLNQTISTEAKIIDTHSFEQELENNIVYFMGNGAAKCKQTITHGHAIFVDGVCCSAAGMAQLAGLKFEQKQFEDVAYFEPFYLKDFVATTPKKRV